MIDGIEILTFENLKISNTIYSELNVRGGFFSQIFFVMNHYLYAKKRGLSFTIESNEWLFKSSKGWEDYFKNIDIDKDCSKLILQINHSYFLGFYSFHEYKNIIKEVYKYNDTTNQKILETKQNLNLLNGAEYDSIFIRRGDKLISESKYIDTSKYIDLLIIKNPKCHTIFLQTDDYNCYLDLQNYILTKNLSINLITLCHENTKGGIFVYEKLITELVEKKTCEITDNLEYILSNVDNIRHSKPVDKMNAEEIYVHTMDMIIGVDIVLHSNICVCEYSSNAALFIKLAHDNNDNVYDVLKPEFEFDMNQNFNH